MSDAQSFCQAGFPTLKEPDNATMLSESCALAFAGFQKTGQYERALWIDLLSRPCVHERQFVLSRLINLHEQAGLTDTALKLRRKLWRLGGRPYSSFAALWPHIQTPKPDLSAWTFIKEALLAAVALDDRSYVLQAVNAAHILTINAYKTGEPYVPFQDVLSTATVREVLARYSATLPPLRPVGGRKLRLCYALSSELGEDYSPITDIVFSLALAHDPAEVEVTLLSVFEEELVMGYQRARTAITALKDSGVRTIFYKPSQGSQFLSFVERLAHEEFDCLFFSSTTHQLFPLMAVRPAHLMAGLCLGPPDFYTSPILDFAIGKYTYPATECPCPSYRVSGFLPPDRYKTPDQKYDKADFGVPRDAPLVISSGRPLKFFSGSYWKVVGTILNKRPDIHFIFVGPTLEETKEWLEGCIEPEHQERLHFLGFRNDHHEVLAMADVCLDTFPMAGGYNLTEMMHLGLPTVLCRNKIEDYFEAFDNALAIPVGEDIDDPSLCFAWDDVEGIQSAVLGLLDDEDLRARSIALGKKAAAARNCVAKNAKEIEMLVLRHLAALLQH